MPFGNYNFLIQNLKNGKWKREKTFFLDSSFKETTNKYESNQQLIRISCCLELTGLFVKSWCWWLFRLYVIILLIVEDDVQYIVKY